ncbi:MAG: hypothetical protein WCC00_07470 [Candidatus Aminicenantales bacterium]
MTKPRFKGPAVFAALAMLAAAAGAVFAEVPPEVRAKAAGIFAALEKIEAEAERTPALAVPPLSGTSPGSRSLTFSEAELNAYAACRLENEPYVRAAVLKLLAGDMIEGRVTIDLGKPQASGLIPQRQDLLFAARIETRDGKIRIAMDSLYLGTQAISPAFIDIVIGVVSRLQGVEPTSLKDWYDLPPGVLRLESRPGQVVVIY